MKNFKKILSIILCMAMLISSVLFVSATENFGTLPHTVALNNSTVGLTKSGGTVFDNWFAILYRAGDGITYTFTANAAETYFLDIAMNANVNATLDVTVNGDLVADDAAIPVNNWLGGTPKQKTFAIIDVVEGENTITITRNTTSSEQNNYWIQFAKLIFSEAREDIASNPATLPLYTADTTIAPAGSPTLANKTATEVILDQTGSVTKTIYTAEEKEYILQLDAGTGFADGRVLSVAVNGQSLGNFTVPYTGAAVTTSPFAIGKITLAVGTNTIKITRPGTSAGGQVGVRNIILTEEEFELSEFTTNGETGVASVTAKAVVTGETNAVMVVAMLDANGMILKYEPIAVQCAANSVETKTLTVTTEGISGTVVKAQAFLWDCGDAAAPSIFNTTMIELQTMCESLND